MSKLTKFLKDLQLSTLNSVYFNKRGSIVSVTRQMYFWDFPDMMQQIMKDNV